MEGFFNAVIENSTKRKVSNLKFQSIGGGCINSAARLYADNRQFFIKWNKGQKDMFQKELLGLTLLEEHSELNVPNTYDADEIDGKGYLLMEYIEAGQVSHEFWENLGKGLANQHSISSDKFGLVHNNYIGRLSQENTFHNDWIEFFVNCRLLPQLKLARNKTLIDEILVSKFDALFIQLPKLLPVESPALLHGDLWSGNIHCGISGKAYVIDPAVYFGHREAELSFTKLFGGFNQTFYSSYESVNPLQSGFESRIDIYNLYPLLVHVNLFGSSYLNSITSTLNRYV